MWSVINKIVKTPFHPNGMLYICLEIFDLYILLDFIPFLMIFLIILKIIFLIRLLVIIIFSILFILNNIEGIINLFHVLLGWRR